jgi:hypothetical protein
MSTTSPYPRENYFGESDTDRDVPVSAGEYGSGDGPQNNPGPAGVWNPDPNDPAEHIAHQTLKDCGELLCRTTLEEPPYNGGRLAELIAWLEADDASDLIDGHAWAMHRCNDSIALSEPRCYPPAERAGLHRHRRRVNEETGYLNWRGQNGTTSVVIPDRPFEDFMAAVNVWLARRDGSLPPRRREKALAYARRLKKQGEKSDQEALRLVIKKTREKDLPER